MYAFIKNFQNVAAGLGYSATSLTDFTTWFNGLRNGLVSSPSGTPVSDPYRNQIKLDILFNAAYLVAKGKTSNDIDMAVRDLLDLDPTIAITNQTGSPAFTFASNVAGSSLPATSFITAELAQFDKIVNDNSQVSNASVNTLQNLT